MKSLKFIILFSVVYQFCLGQNKTFTLQEIDSLTQNSQERTASKNNFKIVENIPVYKGCEHLTNNSEVKKCMSSKINKLVMQKYNLTLANSLGLSNGMIKIMASFKVNKEGKVIDLKARGPHPELEKEAIRVLSSIPNFTPGYQRGKPVVVPYTIPIRLFLDNGAKQTYPIYRGCDKSLTYTEAKRCSIEKIKNFIKLSFDYDIADRALPLEKSTKFELNFVVNKKGRVENIDVKANHRAIAIEAIKTAKRLPKFKSTGKTNDKPVNTPMSITMTIYF